MTLQEIFEDILTLGDVLKSYEIKFGILSEFFYESYSAGEEPESDEWVEDWEMWAGTYEIWMKRNRQYRHSIQSLTQQSHALAFIIGKAARRESILIPA